MELVFDIEANGLSEVVIDKGPQPEVSKVWCLVIKNLHTKQVHTFRQHEIEKGVELLRQANAIIGHNIIMYDVPVLERLYGPINVKKVDTLIISRRS